MSARTKKNPAGTVPVWFMNPGGEPVAATRRRRKKKKSSSKRRRSPVRASAAPRRRRKGSGRRRRRTRRNPSADGKGMAIAALAGGAAGLGAYALQGTELSGNVQTGIVAGAGLVGGAITSMFSPGAGFALMGAGAALGAVALANKFLVSGGSGSQPTQTSAIEAELHAVRAQLEAVRADIGYMEADLRAVAA